MYKRILFVSLVLVTLLLDQKVAFCQTTYNIVRTVTARKPIATPADIVSDSRTNNEVLRVTEYIDGFGRPVQTVSKQTSYQNKDAVEVHVYDTMGREVQQYLPFISNMAQSGDVTNDGNFKTDALQQQAAFNQVQYPGETYYYSKVDFENSPLNRTLKEYPAGSSWVGASRGTSAQYLVNTAADNVRIWNIVQTAGSLPASTAAYGAGKLYKAITVDEKGVQTIRYQDKDGNTVLEKVQLTAAADNGTGSPHSGWLCTYYVYDDYNNLRFVITPKVVQAIDGTWTISQTQASELCIRTEYDLQNRVVIKKMPGSGEQWYVYDKRSRLVMSQDANQRALHKWQYYQYDNLDRQTTTGLMTDPTNYNNRSYHQTNAAGSIAYPNLASYTTELLSQTYYDNYSWTGGTGLGSSLDQTNISNTTYFYTPSNTTAPYPQAITQTASVRGMTTGSKTEVLGSGGSQYLYATSFYDDKGRIIQSQGTNITGGMDKSTTQYSWRGDVLRTLYQQANNANGESHKVLTKMTYDHEGDLLTTRETIYSTIGGSSVNSPEKMIDSCSYNELGQLRTKSMGNNPATGSPLETQTFDYNIRGWMTGINKGFTVASSTANYFGMEMGYDKSTTTAGGTTFTPIYNGGMSGEIWKTKGDKIPRKYSLTYDNAGRMTVAAYLQNSSGSTWDKSTIDFSVNSMSYDYNGNITTLNQKGYTPGGSATIDSLTYDYMNSGTSNKLLNVIDRANNAQSKLGDFHYTGSKTSTSTDYTYDTVGNQISDVNKAISSITYNALNLPQTITVTGKGTITYTYDAEGNKLKKVTQQNNAAVRYNGTNYTTNITTTTTYLGGFVYQSRSYSNVSLASLQYSDSLYILQPEGRARLTNLSTGKGYAFDYFIRDNLGNVRVVLTDEQQQDTYPAATLESGGIATEQRYYNIINDATHVIATSSLSWYSSVSGYSYQNNNGIPSPPDPTINRTATSTKLYKLKGGSGGDRYGLGIVLKVMAGDQVSIFGKSVWHSTTTTSNTYPLSGVLSSFLSSFAGTTTVMVASKGTATGPVLNGNSAVTAPLTTLLGSEPPPSGQAPKAYISWIVFDDQFRATSMGSDPVNSAADVVKSHAMTGISVSKNGFVYIYCSNESNQDVYFDNLQVVHTRGPLIQEQHYYPQGLTMAGISSAAFGKLQANYGYQGKEMQNGEFADSTGLEEYDFEARYYDPQLGRWWVQDPAGQFASPYLAMGNTWPNGTDDDGRIFGIDDLVAAGIGAAVNVASNIGNIHGVGSFFGYLAVGALSGEATYYGGPMAGGAVLGIGNNLTQQISKNGLHNIDWTEAASNGAFGALTGSWGGALGSSISPYVSNALSGIASPVLRNAAIQSVSGGIVGFGIGTGGALLGGDNIGTALKTGAQGAALGLATGAISGGIYGLKLSRESGRNPWTGRLDPKRYELKPINSNPVSNASSNNQNSLPGEIKYHPRLDQQLDANHNYPRILDEYIMKHGGQAIRLNDGSYWFEMQGYKNGVLGVFQIGMTQEGVIFHRNFINWAKYIRMAQPKFNNLKN